MFEMSDLDFFMNCDIMDGWDVFLIFVCEKYYEFLFLWWVKFFIMVMLVEFYNNGVDWFVYSCNICKRYVEMWYNCNECEVYR